MKNLKNAPFQLLGLPWNPIHSFSPPPYFPLSSSSFVPPLSPHLSPPLLFSSTSLLATEIWPTFVEKAKDNNINYNNNDNNNSHLYRNIKNKGKSKKSAESTPSKGLCSSYFHSLYKISICIMSQDEINSEDNAPYEIEPCLQKECSKNQWNVLVSWF